MAGKEGSKGKCVVRREDNHITWTASMRENVSKLKDAIREKTAVNIPPADREYAIHVDASDFGLGAVLEQHDEHGQWVLFAFSAEGRNRDSICGGFVRRRHMLWSPVF